MNYYEHHIGDFAKSAGYLSMLEEGAYRRLLDAYYTREEPLPAEVKACCKLARATTKPERDAVTYVLQEFFTEQADGWHQKRCDEEIERYADKRAKAQRSANARWNGSDRNANASPTAMRTHSEGNARQSPVTNISATEPNGSDAKASVDGKADPIWGAGLSFLRSKGVPEKQARSLLGKLRQTAGDVETGSLLAHAESEDITEPAPWLMAAAAKAKARAGPLNGKPSAAATFRNKTYTGTAFDDLPADLRPTS